MSWQDDAMADQAEADALFNMGEAEWREMYKKEKVSRSFKDKVLNLFYDDYFRNEKGHHYTDEQITISVVKGDIDDCLTNIKQILYKHFGVKE